MVGADNNLDEIIDSIIKNDNPWMDPNNDNWYKHDGALREVIKAETNGWYNPPKLYYMLRQKFFEKLSSSQDDWGIIIIRGPRRIGKTSTLKYIIKKLIEEGFDRESFIYVTLDNEKLLSILDRKKFLRELLKQIISRYKKPDKPLFIILDEATFYSGWARALKNSVDGGDIPDGVGIIVTGSYSLDLSNAKSVLSGRYGKYGEEFNGEVSFLPRRFIEVAESLLGEDFRNAVRKNLGYMGRRLGILEYLGGFQNEKDDDRYKYSIKIENILLNYYSNLHGMFESIYLHSGGYPRAFYEFVTKSYISDARYKGDIYDLLINDCKKFRLSPEILEQIILKIKLPSIQISADFHTLTDGITSLKKDEVKMYIEYLEASGLFQRVRNISSPNEINKESLSVIPKGDSPKLVVTDPCAFLALYACSRGQTSKIFEFSQKLLKENDHIKELLYESIVISHLKNMPQIAPSNLGYIVECNENTNNCNEELCDAFIWYYSSHSTVDNFVTIPIEVKATKNINEREITKKSERLQEYGAKKLIVVADTDNIKIEENYSIIPIELFLLLF